MMTLQNRYPAATRRGVVAVTRRRQAPLAQIAKDFGISDATLYNWLHRADLDDGVRPGPTSSESAELREVRMRNRVLEQRTRSSADLRELHDGQDPSH